MFITKKNYQKALDEQKEALNREWERRMAEYDDQRWRRESEDRYREDVDRRLAGFGKRLDALEKHAGLAEEKPHCPFEPKAPCY